jgi:hypothetical protein
MKKLILKSPTRKIVGYKTFAEAVRRNELDPRSRQARETSQQIAGRSITDACWDDAHLSLLFSEGNAICFSAVDEQVSWELVNAAQFGAYRSSWASDPELIQLIRRGKNDKIMTNEMDREGVIQRMVGKVLRALGTDEFGVYLHVKYDRRYLSLHAGTVADTELPFLEWFEDEEWVPPKRTTGE